MKPKQTADVIEARYHDLKQYPFLAGFVIGRIREECFDGLSSPVVGSIMSTVGTMGGLMSSEMLGVPSQVFS